MVPTQLAQEAQITISSTHAWMIIGLLIALLALGLTSFFVWLNRSTSVTDENGRRGVRERLALGIVFVGICSVAGLGIVGIAFGDENFRATALGSSLPLLGAWVGAVIAYYFGKEQFEVAAEQTNKLLSRGQKLAKYTARDIMIPLPGSGTSGAFVEDTDGNGVIVDEKANEFAKTKMGRNRRAVLKKNGHPLMAIHRSTLTDYATTIDAAQGQPEIKHIETNAPDLWRRLTTYETASMSESLDRILDRMESKGTDCTDVFITENGNRDSRAIGWITNVDILRKADG